MALGDKKGYITVWTTAKAKPIFKVQLSESKNTITDMTWSRCGFILLVSCLDGFMSAIKFEASELGTPLSSTETNNFFKSKYGVSRGAATVVDGEIQLAQSALQMKMKEANKATVLTSISTNSAASYSVSSPNKGPKDTLAQQKVSRTKKGKKRIMPVLVSVNKQQALDPSSVCIGSNGNGSYSPPGGASAPALISESAPAPAQAPAQAPAAAATTTGPPTTVPASAAPSTAAGPKSPSREASSAQLVSSQAASSPSTIAEKVRSTAAEQAKKRQKNSHFSQPSASNTNHGGDKAPSSDRRPGLFSPNSGVGVVGRQVAGIANVSNQIIVDVCNVKVLSTELSTPQHPPPTIASAPCATPLSPAITAQARNASLASNKEASRVCCTNSGTFTLSLSMSGNVTWEETIVGRATAICSCKSFLAVGTMSGEVYVYRTEEGSSWGSSKSGKAIRALPCLAVGGAGIAALNLYEYAGEDSSAVQEVRLMCVSAVGEISLWDLHKRKKVGSATRNVFSAMDAMSRLGVEEETEGKDNFALPALQRAFLETGHLDSDNEPMCMILLQKENCVGGSLQGFYWHPGFECWLRVSDAR